MAVGRPSPTDEVRRRSFGTFQIIGGKHDRRVTLTRDLDDYPFPNGLGDEVRVELVEYEDRPNRLEIIPCSEEGE